MSLLENIFYNYDKLNDNYVDLPETKEANVQLWDYVKRSTLQEEEKEELEDFILSLVETNEKQGFIYGFKCATELIFCENESRSLNTMPPEVYEIYLQLRSNHEEYEFFKLLLSLPQESRHRICQQAFEMSNNNK